MALDTARRNVCSASREIDFFGGPWESYMVLDFSAIAQTIHSNSAPKQKKKYIWLLRWESCLFTQMAIIFNNSLWTLNWTFGVRFVVTLDQFVFVKTIVWIWYKLEECLKLKFVAFAHCTWVHHWPSSLSGWTNVCCSCNAMLFYVIQWITLPWLSIISFSLVTHKNRIE